ncbi:V protein [Orthorubulavirus simiae]|uniref:Non-structural protein V n=1 Tax=Simian virus 41 TaxID=3052561 RepID=V_SV41|nr:V protein [Orthorubulavirus simiae]P36315.1 RecName: Full=Non-structural protein V [Orthorubulavirus simiae]AAB26639.1 V protein [Orthorubulavirus simiae]CAA45571.1 V protein [Orthorubulavirus simiae]
MAEEPTYTAEQVNDVVHAGLGTVDFFLSRPVDGQSSLGKGSVPPGITAVLTNAAELKAKTAAAAPVKPKRKKIQHMTPAYTIADNGDPNRLPANTPIANPLIPIERPPGRMTDLDLATGTVTQGTYKGVELAKAGKNALLTRFSSGPSLTDQASSKDPNFKRGGEIDGRHKGRHRREWSIAWVGDEVKVYEWCNPTCAPVTATDRKFSCTCGTCPDRCGECEGDN